MTSAKSQSVQLPTANRLTRRDYIVAEVDPAVVTRYEERYPTALVQPAMSEPKSAQNSSFQPLAYYQHQPMGMYIDHRAVVGANSPRFPRVALVPAVHLRRPRSYPPLPGYIGFDYAGSAFSPGTDESGTPVYLCIGEYLQQMRALGVTYMEGTGSRAFRRCWVAARNATAGGNVYVTRLNQTLAYWGILVVCRVDVLHVLWWMWFACHIRY